VLEAGFGCKMQQGKLVCGKGQKKDDDDHDDDDDDDDKPKKQKQGVDAGLTECTIQQPGGGGCKSGLKRVCEKLKSGKKCSGCVPDPNAKPENKTTGGDQPQALVFACTSDVEAPDGRIVSNRKAGVKAANDAEARIIYMTSLPQGALLRGDLHTKLELQQHDSAQWAGAPSRISL
jgi:hypothetical protein